RKGGNALPGETNSSLTLTNVSGLDNSSYCVEVSGFCNSVTNCAILTVLPPSEITCPSNLVLNCPSEVPSADTNLVIVSSNASLSYVQDVVVTNSCGLLITRYYQAVDSCGSTSSCSQVILVANTNPPVITCASNQTIECGTARGFSFPTAIDFCG